MFFALVGAVGTNLAEVQQRLEQELSGVGYKCHSVRLSQTLKAFDHDGHLSKIDDAPEDDRIDKSMVAGNALRKRAKQGDAVSTLSLGSIQKYRKDNHAGDSVCYNTAYILNSLKHPREISVLRKIYKDQLIVVSVYAPKEERIKILSDRIAKSHGSLDPSEYKERAEELIKTDEKEDGEDLGQNVRETFPEADVFINSTEGADLLQQIKRLVEIVFGHPFRTPTKDEYGMFHALAASLRSADVSRQVGAAIFSGDGELVASGCNEVPSEKGGSYWEDDDTGIRDNRDFVRGIDYSVHMKKEMIKEIFKRLPKEWFADAFYKLSDDKKVYKALEEGDIPPLKGSRVASILEFGRIVHAEMSAITSAARRGLAIKDTALYCNVYPCHMCARHIIASGIKKVIYIEPYPKSMTKKLYNESVRIDNASDASSSAVEFNPFFGIAPRRFIKFFEMTQRKTGDGRIIVWDPFKAQPRVDEYPNYTENEATNIDLINKAMAIS